MARSLSERKVLKKLGISDFRHMTKDKVVEFASMLHKMDPAVAMKALEQFPHYTQLASEMVDIYREVSIRILEANTSSMKPFYDVCSSIIATLQKELERDNITSEERAKITEKMIEVARMIGEKDTENKHFLITILQWGGGVLLTLGGGALILLGLKPSSGGDDDDA